MSLTTGINTGIAHTMEKHSIEKLSTGQALKQLGRNAKDILSQNSLSAQLQNPTKLKTNSLIISSLILVVSRIMVAHLSAVKAKGTEDESHRTREAIRTFIREICGWTFSYMVLRRIQAAVKQGMKNFFKISDTDSPSALRQLWDSLNKAVKRLPHSIDKIRDAAEPDVFKIGRMDRVERMTGWLEKTGITRLMKKPINHTSLLKSLYQWAPIVIGSIPAVLLAGYVLERFTRDHSDKVVATIGKKFGLTKPPQQSSLANQRFSNFVQHVQQKQVERGFTEHH